MKQTDIYTEALTCLRSILLADQDVYKRQIRCLILSATGSWQKKKADISSGM